MCIRDSPAPVRSRCCAARPVSASRYSKGAAPPARLRLRLRVAEGLRLTPTGLWSYRAGPTRLALFDVAIRCPTGLAAQD
eukprot:scaffold94988_cov54-Phaeocystis_antarctica.AAC.3